VTWRLRWRSRLWLRRHSTASKSLPHCSWRMWRICSSDFRNFVTHMANSTLAGSGHAAGYTTMPRACLGSSSSSHGKVDPHLPQVVRSKAGRDIRLPWGITHHIHRISIMAPPTTIHTPSHNHSSNFPSSHLAPAPHRARRAPRASPQSYGQGQGQGLYGQQYQQRPRRTPIGLPPASAQPFTSIERKPRRGLAWCGLRQAAVCTPAPARALLTEDQRVSRYVV
jgi:hypothetical protein